MLDLPEDPTSSLKLADWLEIIALVSRDGNASRSDLERVLRRAALLELSDDSAIESKLLEVFHELEQRSRSAMASYPFDLDYGVLQTRSAWVNYPAYVFCLCLSYFGTQSPAPRKLFEYVSVMAAKRYLAGEAINFGFPRIDMPRGFQEAVTKLCMLVGEGDFYSDQPSNARKDDKLDLVAWKDFPDSSPSKLLLFGQCASGWDWQEKLNELNPRAFCEDWMREVPVSPLISSLFIPHRIERFQWKFAARRAGVLFDRCRIAYWAHGSGQEYDDHIQWITATLEKLM